MLQDSTGAEFGWCNLFAKDGAQTLLLAVDASEADAIMLLRTAQESFTKIKASQAKWTTLRNVTAAVIFATFILMVLQVAGMYASGSDLCCEYFDFQGADACEPVKVSKVPINSTAEPEPEPEP